jgi:hypothetical protein
MMTIAISSSMSLATDHDPRTRAGSQEHQRSKGVDRSSDYGQFSRSAKSSGRSFSASGSSYSAPSTREMRESQRSGNSGIGHGYGGHGDRDTDNDGRSSLGSSKSSQRMMEINQIPSSKDSKQVNYEGQKVSTDVKAYITGRKAAVQKMGPPPAKDSQGRVAYDEEYMREFYKGVAKSYTNDKLKPELQKIPSGPMDAITKNANIERRDSYYDPRVNEAAWAGTSGNESVSHSLSGQALLDHVDVVRNDRAKAAEKAYKDQDIVAEIDREYRAGNINVSVPGKISSAVANLENLTNVQKYGAANSVVVTGYATALDKITYAQHGGLVVGLRIDKNTGKSQARMKSPNNAGASPYFRDEMLGGIAMTSSKFGGVAAGGMIMLPTKKRVNGKDVAYANRTDKAIETTLVHELTHTGDEALLESVRAELKSENLTEEKREELEEVLDSAEMARQERTFIRMNLFSKKRSAKKAFNNDSYLSTITEYRAMTSSETEEQYVDRLQRSLGISNEEAQLVADSLAENETLKQIDKDLEGYAGSKLNK